MRKAIINPNQINRFRWSGQSFFLDAVWLNRSPCQTENGEVWWINAKKKKSSSSCKYLVSGASSPHVVRNALLRLVAWMSGGMWLVARARKTRLHFPLLLPARLLPPLHLATFLSSTSVHFVFCVSGLRVVKENQHGLRSRYGTTVNACFRAEGTCAAVSFGAFCVCVFLFIYFLELKIGQKLNEGKTKQIFELVDQPGLVLVQSKDQITAGNAVRKDQMEGKAAIANKTTSCVFKLLQESGENSVKLLQDWLIHS